MHIRLSTTLIRIKTLWIVCDYFKRLVDWYGTYEAVRVIENPDSERNSEIRIRINVDEILLTRIEKRKSEMARLAEKNGRGTMV